MCAKHTKVQSATRTDLVAGASASSKRHRAGGSGRTGARTSSRDSSGVTQGGGQRLGGVQAREQAQVVLPRLATVGVVHHQAAREATAERDGRDQLQLLCGLGVQLHDRAA